MSGPKLLAVFVLALAAAACGGAGVGKPQRADSAPAAARGVAPAEIETADVGAPFERATVVKLNAIVRRALTAIQAYDGAIDAVRAAVDDAAGPKASAAARRRAEDGVRTIADFHARAAAAQRDLHRAANEIEASGEKYDADVLANMVAFVDTVERETAAETTALRQRLGS